MSKIKCKIGSITFYYFSIKCTYDLISTTVAEAESTVGLRTAYT